MPFNRVVAHQGCKIFEAVDIRDKCHDVEQYGLSKRFEGFVTETNVLSRALGKKSTIIYRISRGSSGIVGVQAGSIADMVGRDIFQGY